MQKGIVETILIYTLVLILCFSMTHIIELSMHSLLLFFFPERHLLVVFVFFTSIGFVLLGFHLRSKYNKELNYWRFFILGVIISISANIIFYLGYMIYFELISYRSFSWENIFKNMFPIDSEVIDFTIISIIVCSVVALFHDYYKTKSGIFSTKKSDPESPLDTDLLNDE